MRWLPARCWENGVYGVFSNAIGVDDDTIKPGLAMILDPFGEVIAESRALDDDVVVALLTAERLEQSSGRRYLRARRPELYGKLVEPPPPGQEPVTKPGWGLAHESSRDRGRQRLDRQVVGSVRVSPGGGAGAFFFRSWYSIPEKKSLGLGCRVVVAAGEAVAAPARGRPGSAARRAWGTATRRPASARGWTPPRTGG